MTSPASRRGASRTPSGPAGLGAVPAFAGLPDALRRALEAGSVERRFAPGELLLRGGAAATWCYVLAEGLVREFYVTPDGHEHTRVFVAGGGITGSLLDLRSGAPSVTWIEALESTRAFAIRLETFDALAARYPELESLARRHAEALAIRKTMREYEMLALPASERLARWRAEHPDLDGRVTRRLLASYLGITPVHLSRITTGARTATPTRTPAESAPSKRSRAGRGGTA